MPSNPPTFYAQQISSLYNGLAIWDPQPGYIRHDENELTPRPYVRPGDVGYVEETGSFTRLFNIHFPSDDSRQGRGPFPEYFQHIESNSDNDLRTESANVYHKSRRLKIFGGVKTIAYAIDLSLLSPSH